jgi:hypothetical protein
VEWAAALRALGAAAETAGGPRERLLRVVEDPAADAVDRVAAAVALGGDRDEENRARLHAAVNTVAAPKLRLALERAVASESEAEREAMLAELEGLLRRRGRGPHARLRTWPCSPKRRAEQG